MPSVEQENRDRPKEATGRKPNEQEPRNMSTEDDDLPYDVQVAKSCMRDHGEMHKCYSGGIKKMGNPMVKKSLMKSCNAHVDAMEAIKAASEKAYPEHKIHGIDIPAKYEMRKSSSEDQEDEEEDEEDEDEDEGGEEGEDAISEKSLLSILGKVEELGSKYDGFLTELANNAGA